MSTRIYTLNLLLGSRNFLFRKFDIEHVNTEKRNFRKLAYPTSIENNFLHNELSCFAYKINEMKQNFAKMASRTFIENEFLGTGSEL